MRTLTNEFLVGLLAILAAAMAAYAVMRTDDRPDGVSGTWSLYAVLPSAEGVYPDTPVRIAGVPVGGVDAVTLEGGQARVTMVLQSSVELPADSVVEVKGEGVLGDKYLRITPGQAPVMLTDGATIALAPSGLDLDKLGAKVGPILEDVTAIMDNVRTLTGDEGTQAQLRATMANIEALSAQMRLMAEDNQEDIAVVAQNLREVSEALKQVVGATSTSVTEEMAALKQATETLDRTLSHVESIAARVDRGEGTVGKLLSDSSTVDSVNATLAEVNATVSEVSAMVKDVSRIKTEVYYRGDVYYGSEPNSSAFYAGNPVSGSARNVVGVRLVPRDDYWYIFEFVSHPLGLISYEDTYYPDLGTSYRTYTQKPENRYSFQFAKRWKGLVFRFGLKESSGGIGVDGLLFKDHLQLSADLYDFTYGSWPVMDGTPQLQLTARAYPIRHLYLEGGLDNVILGARYGYVTGFAGGGFSFTDDDLKFVLAALPFSP